MLLLFTQGHTDGRDHVDGGGGGAESPMEGVAIGGAAAPSSAALAELMGLGFSEQQAAQALQACGGDSNAAAAMLLGDGASPMRRTTS